LAGLVFLVVFAIGVPAKAAAHRDDLKPMSIPEKGKFLPGPFFMAGDGDNLWLGRQIAIDGVAHGQLYVHPANQTYDDGQPLWLVQRSGDAAAIGLVPQCLAVVSAGSGKSRWVGVDAIYPSGEVYRVEMNERMFLTRLSGQKPMAAIGSGGDLFVLALGPEKFDATGTGSAATTAPATSASAPATTSATVPADQFWNLLAYHDGHWEQRAGLGRTTDLQQTPGAASPTMVSHYERILAVWRDAQRQLVTRSIDGSKADAAWTAPQLSAVGIATSRVQALTIGPRAFVFWPKRSSGNKVELAGGPLDGDGVLQPDQMLKGMELPSADPTAIDAGVAAGVTGNSIMAVYVDKLGAASTALFSAAGEPLEGPSALEPVVQTHRNVEMFPGLVMAVLVGLLALSLWQWQQKQLPPPTQAPARVARVSIRLVAAMVDLAIPITIVVTAFDLFDVREERLSTLGSIWSEGLANWSKIFTSPEIMLIIGLYLVHVTVGELFWGRSIGKALCHLRVISLDGSKPTALSIIVRNVIRLFEMIPGILLIYMLFNPNRQRLGDLLARTMVISEEAPEEKKGKRPE
jgi:uncharacterized RDD family membrane protein YckC